MATQFPTTGLVAGVTTFTSSGVTWLWSGTVWDVVPSTNVSFNTVTANTVTANLTGNVTGNLTGDLYDVAGQKILDNGTNYGNAAFFGDIYAGNGTSKVINNGTNGTDATFTGTVSTAAQPGITSVGTMTNLTVAGNITAQSNVVIPTAPTSATHSANKQYVDTRALVMSIALS